MSGRTIHEVPLVSEIKGGMKVPISDGGNLPQTASVEQINKFISDQIKIYVKDLLERYVEKIDGKGLSTNDFTNSLKDKLNGLSNYDDTEIVRNVAKLQNVLDTLVSGDVSSKIESFNEIISFLENVEDSESFEGVIAGITSSIKGVESKLSELGSKAQELKQYDATLNVGDYYASSDLKKVLLKLAENAVIEIIPNRYSGYTGSVNKSTTFYLNGKILFWSDIDGLVEVGHKITTDYIEDKNVTSNKLSECYKPLFFTNLKGQESKVNLINMTISNIYIDLSISFPDDMTFDNGKPNVFLRQIYISDGYVYRIWLSYLNTEGEYTPWLEFTSTDKKERILYIDNSYVVVDFTAPSVLGNTEVQPFFSSKGDYQLNWAKVDRYYKAPDKLEKVEDGLQNLEDGLQNLEKVVRQIASIPNNNNYTTWVIGNKIVTRLYIENKDLAKSNGLFLNGILYNYGASNVSGFNFGDKDSNNGAIALRAYGLTSMVGEMSIVSPIYGLVKVKYDFSNYDFGDSTQIVENKYAYNINEIAYDYEEYNHSDSVEIDLGEESIGFNSLSPELKETLLLTKYELFTIGDSMCQSGKWQEVIANKTKINFNQSLNSHPSYPTSIGGTKSDMSKSDSTYFRTLNLLNYGGIEGKGENAVILLENVNDGGFTFNPQDRSYHLENSIKIENLTQSALSNIPTSQRTLNTALEVANYAKGKVLNIDKLPINEGDIKLRVGWSGPSVSDYYIHIKPQETDDATLAYVREKIIEVSYKSVYDNLYGSNGVSFTSGNDSYDVTLEFTDLGTGMECSVTSVNSLPYEVIYWFNSYDLEEWSNVDKWVIPSVSSGWKSSIEAIMRKYPKATIGVVFMPVYTKRQADYLLSNGLYDEQKFREENKSRYLKDLERNQAICDMYNIKLFNIWEFFGITASNYNTYYYDYNVHPKDEGYQRMGDVASGILKSWIV